MNVTNALHAVGDGMAERFQGAVQNVFSGDHLDQESVRQHFQRGDSHGAKSEGPRGGKRRF